MKKFQPHILNDNADLLQELGSDVDSIVTVMEQQAIYDGQYIHDSEFQSYGDYAEYVEPLFKLGDESAVVAALSYTQRFFYLKGLQDSVHIRENLFKRVERSGIRQ